MKNTMKTSKSNSQTGRRIAWLTGIACVACCTLPIIDIAVRSASIAGLAVYSEKAAIAAAVVGILVLVYKRLSQKSGPACDINGSCKPKSAGTSLTKQTTKAD
jgi:hypothetical protein